MPPGREQEPRTRPPTWSVFAGDFDPGDIADSRMHLELIRKDATSSHGESDLTNRVTMFEIVYYAVAACQPKLFEEKNAKRLEVVGRDIGSSVFACYSYEREELDRVLTLRNDPELSARRQLLQYVLDEIFKEGSPISLTGRDDLQELCTATVVHLAFKKLGRIAELPKTRH